MANCIKIKIKRKDAFEPIWNSQTKEKWHLFHPEHIKTSQITRKKKKCEWTY